MPDPGAGHARPSPSRLSLSESGPRRPRRAGALRRAAAAALVLLAGALLAGLAPETAHAQTAQTVENDWALKPSGIKPGESFRLLFVTSTNTQAADSTIGPYNTIVQQRASDSGADATIRGMSGQFRALISTPTVDARDNTATTGTGVPIYWLNGAKVADDYADFYDGNWDSNAPKNQLGNNAANIAVWTGSKRDGTGASACDRSGPGTEDRRAAGPTS